MHRTSCDSRVQSRDLCDVKRSCCSDRARSEEGAVPAHPCPAGNWQRRDSVSYDLQLSRSQSRGKNRSDCDLKADKSCCSTSTRQPIHDKADIDVSATRNDSPEKQDRKACCAPDLVDENDESNASDDDKTLCECCIDYVLEHIDTLAKLPASDSTDAAGPQSNSSSLLTRAWDCCTVFASACCRAKVSVCCSTAGPNAFKGNHHASSKGSLRPLTAKNLVSDKDKGNGSKAVRYEYTIDGMDCSDCFTAVKKALDRLPSVRVHNFDPINTILRLDIREGELGPNDVARYIMRSSGFKATMLDASDHVQGDSITLNVGFAIEPPKKVLEQLNIPFVNIKTSTARNSAIMTTVQLQVPTAGSRARSPRAVLAELAAYGPVLQKAADRQQKRANDNLIQLAVQTGISVIGTLPVLILVWASYPDKDTIKFRWIEFAFATLVQACGWPIYGRSLRSLWYLRTADLGLLVTVSTWIAYSFSVVALAFAAAGRPFAKPFFETAALLLSLVLVGRLIHSFTRRSVQSALKALQDLQANVALVVSGQAVEVVDARLLYYDDIVRVLPGSRVPSDGIVVDGKGSIDESAVTGESLPVIKRFGSTVLAGTTNLEGQLDVQVTKLVHQNSLASVMLLVETAQSTRTKLQDVADRISAVMLPVALLSSLVAFVAWLFVNRIVRDRSWSSAAVDALTYVIAIMAVSCPCALGLAVPLTVSAAMIAAMKEGILFKSGTACEDVYAANVIAFDKTGTLSQGKMSVVESAILHPHALQIIAKITACSEHPVSAAVASYLASDALICSVKRQQPETREQSETLSLQDVTSIPGAGLSAKAADYAIQAGNALFTGFVDEPTVQRFQEEGMTVYCVSFASHLVAVFGLRDKERSEAAELVRTLEGHKKHVWLVSGDHLGAVQRFASQVGISADRAKGGCTPSTKAEIVKNIQSDGKAQVCFVGDGTNDSVAFSTARASASLGAGTDIAKGASNIVLLGNDLKRSVLSMINISALCHWFTLVGIAWCIVYFFFAVLLASGATVHFRIPPQFAGLGEVVSVIPVIMTSGSLYLARQCQLMQRGGRRKQAVAS